MRPAPLVTSRGFTIFFRFLQLGSRHHFLPRHRPCGSRRHCRLTDSFHPPDIADIGAPDPLSRLGQWERCSGLANSMTSFSGLCWIGSESPMIMVEEYCCSYAEVKGSKPSLGNSTPGWTQSRGWSASSFWGSAGTTQDTSCTCYYLSRSSHIIRIRDYWPSLGSSPWIPPPVMDIPIEAFAIWRAVHHVPWEDHHMHVEGAPPPAVSQCYTRGQGSSRRTTNT